jgi:hypothetical protein
MLDAGVYYRVPPDVSIVQVMLMGGIAVALFGVLGLAAGIRHLIRAGGLRVALLEARLSGMSAVADQRPQHRVPGQRRAGASVVTAVYEHRIVDGRAQGSQVVMGAKQPGCTVHAERVRQADAIERPDQLRGDRAKAGCPG